MQLYKCISEAETPYGFIKGNYYLFDNRYGTMINHELKNVYYWKPSEYGFEQIHKTKHFLTTIFVYIAYTMIAIKSILNNN